MVFYVRIVKLDQINNIFNEIKDKYTGHREMSTVYALELEDGRYYIGKTVDMDKRYNEHLTGHRSSTWTRKYKPLSIIETIPNAHCLDEDKLTAEYMMKHGIDNVRGGPYVSVKLHPNTVAHITKRLRMAYDLCMKCGKPGHFGAHCTDHRKKKLVLEPPICGTCGSGLHFTEDCEFSQPI